MTAILGIDFTSAPRPRKPITVACGRLARGAFAIEAVPDWPGFDRLLAAPAGTPCRISPYRSFASVAV